MKKIQHFVLTRFNLKISTAFATDKNLMSTQSDEWLSHRFDLFERYCLPSFAAQTNKDFTWFLFFDESTPEIYRQRIHRAQEICPQIKACFIKGIDIVPVMAEYVDDDTDILITTRIDNDDAFRDDALAVIRHEAVQARDDLCINFRFGYSYDGRHAEVFSQKYNPFSSLVEHRKAGGFVTIFGAGHGKIYRLAKVKQIKTGPYWLMVVHDRNVANRMPGEYKYYSLWKWRRLKRYLRKYLFPRIRKVFWPAAFKGKFSIEELNDRFHLKIQ